jgi:hypothetical protein
MVAAVPEWEDWVVMNSSSPECIRLWREYSAETIAHFKADSILKLAVLRHDADTISRAATLAEQIMAEREAAREAIRKHETSRHFS